MKKMLIITGICTTLLIISCLQFNSSSTNADPRGESFAGSKACVKCHSRLYDSYLHTAHYIASIPANDSTVHGRFDSGANMFDINKTQKMVMEKRDSGMYQTYYLNGKMKDTHRFDIVFGGVKGETYLYWKGNELYQLPLSYFTQQHHWSTSPGYGFNFVDYRAIGIRCMECHASYINTLPNEKQQLTGNDQFDKSTLVYGVDCERCHGPAAKHVEFQTNNPTVKTAQFITKYTSLTRGQKMDMCAVCHSGIHPVLLRSTFGFMPGDTFAKFKLPEFQQKVDTGQVDVHGKQLQLLQSSKCYVYSKMDCTTCHDTHQNSRGNDALFTQKCLDCHNTADHTYCKMTNKLSTEALKTNCISCHMPALPTKVISVQVSDKSPSIKFFVHTHHIAIYPQETKKILSYIRK
jgi:hypothetical protein